MNTRPGRFRWLIVPACQVALLAAGRSPAQEPIPQRIRIDLGSGAARSSLPFDEPIVLVGKSPDELVGMRVRYRRASDLPHQFRSSAPSDVACSDTTGEWKATSVWRRQAGVPGDTFAIVMEPLAGERAYVFCMIPLLRPGPDSAAALQARLAAALDQRFRKGSPDSTRAVDFDSLRQDIVGLLKRRPGDSLDIAPGSLFSTDTSGRESMLQVLAIQRSYDARKSALTNFDAATQGATPALYTLAGSVTAFQALTPALRRGQRPGGVSDAAAGCALVSARFFAVPVPGTIERLATGEVALPDADAAPPLQLKPLQLVWDAADVTPRLERLARTQECLGGLRAMAATLVTTKALRDSVGISGPTASVLAARLDAARGELAAVQGALVNLRDALEQRRERLRDAAATVTRLSEVQAPVVGSTLAVSFDARARRYISMDLGVLHAPDADVTTPYYGASLTLCPVNKRVRLPSPLRNPGSLCKSLSVVAGLTLKSVAKTDERDDLFGQSAGVLGLGLRVLDVFRVTGGGMLLRDVGGTSAAPTRRLAVTPFTSLSFDLDLQSLFTNLTTLITR